VTDQTKPVGANAGIEQWLRASRLPGVLLIAVLLLLWQLSATLLVDKPTWPPVTRIFAAWVENIVDGTLLGHLLATFWRQMLGYGLAVVLGVALGLAMGYFRVLYNLFEPLVEILRPIPGPAYLPVLVLFVGIGHEMKVVLIMVASFFPILLNTYSGVRSIDVVQFDTARTLGLSTLQTFRELVLPAASPQILTGMRISLAISLILAILGEMIVSNDGLGYFVLLCQRTFKVPEMYAGIFTLAVFGYVLNRVFLLAEARLIKRHRETSGRN
jgi:ABC-type nitrate/sulfonate/bicarbonate transport system permease component